MAADASTSKKAESTARSTVGDSSGALARRLSVDDGVDLRDEPEEIGGWDTCVCVGVTGDRMIRVRAVVQIGHRPFGLTIGIQESGEILEPRTCRQIWGEPQNSHRICDIDTSQTEHLPYLRYLPYVPYLYVHGALYRVRDVLNRSVCRLEVSDCQRGSESDPRSLASSS
jgi:hypothetical protein